jgi:hypothetical protein
VFENQTTKSFLRKMLPRIVKATIKAVLYLIFLYIIPMIIVSQLSAMAPEIFAVYMDYLTIFAAIVIFSVVASELTAGTIFQHAFNIGRALVLIIFFILALKGGIISQDIAVESMRLHFVVDLRVYLAMLISIDLLSLAKSMLQAVSFLSQRVEQQHPMPQPTEEA